MRISIENGCYYFTHSRYYSQWVGGLPFSPQIYWNIVTDDDIIPVWTYGYKNVKSSQQQIKKHIPHAKEYRVIHIQTEEEQRIEEFKRISKWVEVSKSFSNGEL
jgi:hypothetical protein